MKILLEIVSINFMVFGPKFCIKLYGTLLEPGTQLLHLVIVYKSYVA